MILPKAAAAYDVTDQDQLRTALEQEDKRNLKAGTVFDRILLRDTVTGVVVALSVASGAVVVT